MESTVTLLASDGVTITLPETHIKLCKAVADLVGECGSDGTPIPVAAIDGPTLLKVKDYLLYHWDNPFVTDRPGTGQNPDEPEMPDPPIETFNPENPPGWTMKDSKGNVWTSQDLAEHWAKPSPNRRTNVTLWDKQLMDVPFGEMVKFAKAARFLGHEEMYRMACKCLAEHDLKVLPCLEVTKENIAAHRQYYGIVSDFTPEEEEEAMKEDKWREYGPGDPRNHKDIN